MRIAAVCTGFALLVAPSGCAKREDPAERTGAATTQPRAAKQPPRGKRTRVPSTGPVRIGPPTNPDAALRAPAPVAAPVLFAEDGGLLEQTDALPSPSSPFFRQQAERLFRAIVQDDPAIAKSFFFPVAAYRVVKASKNPDRDYERRLIALFERDIHAYHRRLGDEPERARFIELYVPEGAARWMKPGSEGNKLGYHRVLRSQLRYVDAAGSERSLEVTSLISWRGEWYVVHLNGFE